MSDDELKAAGLNRLRRQSVAEAVRPYSRGEADKAALDRVRWLAQGYEDVARMDSDATVPLALVAAQIRAALKGDGW